MYNTLFRLLIATELLFFDRSIEGAFIRDGEALLGGSSYLNKVAPLKNGQVYEKMNIRKILNQIYKIP